MRKLYEMPGVAVRLKTKEEFNELVKMFKEVDWITASCFRDGYYKFCVRVGKNWNWDCKKYYIDKNVEVITLTGLKRRLGMFKVGDEVVCVDLYGYGYLTEGKSYKVIDDEVCKTVNIVNDMGHEHKYETLCFKLKENNMGSMWKEGDIISKYNYECEVLGVCGKVIFISKDNNFEKTENDVFTQKELELMGWRLKTDTPEVEVTLEEIAKLKGVDVSQVRIKD